MILALNRILSPLSKNIKKYQEYISYFLLFLSFASLSYLWIGNTKDSGEQALLILWILLWLPIFAKVIGLELAQVLMPLRKELGILMGMLALIHSFSYIGWDVSYVVQKDFWIESNGFPSYLAFGFLALICTIPLLLTSNRWAIQKLGKHWKMLHRLVYFVVLFTIVHVVLLQFARHFEVGPVIVLVLYFVAKVLEWRGVSWAPRKVYPKGQKWLCVPCGYIYDPAIGDLDSGVSVGTEFIDIPDDWKCPVCGVSKSDFVALEEGMNAVPAFDAQVIQKKFLNPTTVELIIETQDIFPVQLGQFVTFLWRDTEGEFTRSYSIAHYQDRRFTFLIKLTDLGRGARLIRTLGDNESIQIRGVFGSFVLQDTDNPKIFIATGTGLAPIYAMINSLSHEKKKTLYFTVATGSELFYQNELNAIENLDLHIHTTKEQVEGCEFGRVDVDSIEADIQTEWYLCGNPRMIAEAREKLTNRGFVNIFSEEF